MLEETYIPISTIIFAMILLAFIIDVITKGAEAISKSIPGLPDSFDTVLTYLITIAISYLICIDGDIDIFKYFNIEFKHIGILLSAIIISGGSKVLRDRLELASIIPMSISGINSTMKNIIKK